MAVGVVYAFSVLGDSPVFSAALTEVVDPAYLGSALGLRSLLGYVTAAIAPLVFGAVLDFAKPAGGQPAYTAWGWAFVMLGLGGLGAAIAARRFDKLVRVVKESTAQAGNTAPFPPL